MLNEFFAQVLPAEVGEYYAVVTIQPDTGKTVQKEFISRPAMAGYCEQCSAAGKNVFYAMATYTQAWHDDPTGRISPNTGVVRKVFRTQQNASKVKAFWLDIDVGAGVGKAPDLAHAVAAVTTLCTTVGMPLPSLVASGGGLHVYWILEEAIEASSWNAASQVLDAIVRHLALPVDPSRTSDIASILRPVGTRNWKYSPAVMVQYLHRAPTISYKDFLVPTATYFQTNNLSVHVKATPVVVANNNNFDSASNAAMQEAFGGYYEAQDDRKNDPIAIVNGCQQVREGGIHTEPIWFGMMGVMRYCEHGKEAARFISKQDPRHEDTQFEAKYDYVYSLTAGPTTCENFSRHNPGGCVGCPNKGFITSPVELGRPRRSNSNALGGTSAPEGSAFAPMAPMDGSLTVPEGYLYPYPGKDFQVRTGDFQGIYKVNKGEGDDAKYSFVTPQLIYLLYAQVLQRSFTDTEVVYIFEVVEPTKETRQVRLTARDLSSPTAFRHWQFNNQLLVTVGNEKGLVAMVTAYIAQLQKKIPQLSLKERFGWMTSLTATGEQIRGFALGNRLLSSNAVPATVAVPPTLEQYSEENLAHRGTLEAWKAVPKFYQDHNILWGQLGVCLGFGGVLMHLAPEGSRNGIVNFWSPKSGTGKSTVQKIINSIWGHPITQLETISSTENAFFLSAGWRHHLPICLNEVTNLEGSDLSSILFQLSEGREKSRMTKDRGIQTPGTWFTTTIMSANNPMLDKLSGAFSGRDGEIKRVLDIEIPMGNVTREDAIKLTDLYVSNYGTAGAAFIQGILDTPGLYESIPTMLKNWIARNSVSQDERFWESTVAAAVLAGRIAKGLGLITYDMDAVEAYAMEQVVSMRGRVINTKLSNVDYLSDFLSENIKSTLVVAAAKRERPPVPGTPLNMDTYIISMPHSELNVRIELQENLMYVRSAAFTEWCRTKHITVDGVLKGLAMDGVFQYGVNRNGKADKVTTVRLGSGVPGMGSTPARCLKFVLPEGTDLATIKGD